MNNQISVYDRDPSTRDLRKEAAELTGFVATVIGPVSLFCFDGGYQILVVSLLVDAIGTAWGWILFKQRATKNAKSNLYDC